MLKEVRAVAGVEEAEMVYGVYDIVAKVKGETMDKLKQIITEHIRRIDKVQTNTHHDGYRGKIARSHVYY
ncbi:MAG TPA: Lrp/AsnC ligand binding domain-containing protein [Candidatus Bathyarchaeia archaeon]|nr:Lrp/AsnC ligand binding domain-containing protein [Candidatus Bathyarchaeia archaeon]